MANGLVVPTVALPTIPQLEDLLQHDILIDVRCSLNRHVFESLPYFSGIRGVAQMPNLTTQILNAVEGGDLEAIRAENEIRLLIDRKPVLTVPAAPHPDVDIPCWGKTKLKIRSGLETIHTLESDNHDEARIVAESIAYCFWTTLPPDTIRIRMAIMVGGGALIEIEQQGVWEPISGVHVGRGHDVVREDLAKLLAANPGWVRASDYDDAGLYPGERFVAG